MIAQPFARRLRLFGLTLAIGLQAALPAQAKAPSKPAGERIERLVLLYRHGVRAPLPGEAGLADLAPAPMADWSTAPTLLTLHGAEALTLLARWQAGQWRHLGLLPAHGCPSPRDLTLHANATERTIASAHALAEGLAPGCDLPVEHKPLGQHDALFEPMEAGTATVDGQQAAQDVNRYTGGAPAMAARQAPALSVMERILGCDKTPKPCHLSTMPGAISASADGHGLSLTGPIDKASGTAQVFLLEYMEGMPLAHIGWGRATPQAIAQVSPLHAALFDVFDRSPYMARRSGGELARQALTALFAPDQPRLTLLIGHDNNIAALTSLLGAGFQVPGLGRNDPPPGGALELALVRRPDGTAFVKAFYVAATPDQVRHLTHFNPRHRPYEQALTLGLCARTACPAATFRQRLTARLLPTVTNR
ncbi:histidine-type phosphatase [Novosphingobium terrae]|uniref:histidine-type phosphatase n=1 Tax=Novosphingobium terrae TaxID=2726189 RepID=UPI00197CC69D|nr:histidine-type phosphatase [Novosphingobium terrae]